VKTITSAGGSPAKAATAALAAAIPASRASPTPLTPVPALSVDCSIMVSSSTSASRHHGAGLGRRAAEIGLSNCCILSASSVLGEPIASGWEAHPSPAFVHGGVHGHPPIAVVVALGADPFAAAVLLAIAGHIIDLGAKSGRMTVGLRGQAVINDSTREDADTAGLSALAEVIDNGSAMPGTMRADCSAKFRRRFAEADLVIAKGQGNFESLHGECAPLFCLFRVKCPTVAAYCGHPVGSLVIWRSLRPSRAPRAL
jgi:hypothetical protein